MFELILYTLLTIWLIPTLLLYLFKVYISTENNNGKYSWSVTELINKDNLSDFLIALLFYITPVFNIGVCLGILLHLIFTKAMPTLRYIFEYPIFTKSKLKRIKRLIEQEQKNLYGEPISRTNDEIIIEVLYKLNRDYTERGKYDHLFTKQINKILLGNLVTSELHE